MNLNIRFATPQDLPAYNNLLQASYQAAYTNEKLGLNDSCFSHEIFASEHTQTYLKTHLLNTDTQKTWLAFVDEKLVGSITCIIQNDHEAELTGFYVSPRNQGQGIGKKLYQLALDFAGDRDLLIDVYLHNTKPIAMYKKWGWQLDETRGDNGYFSRHWPEWPVGLEAKCMYMRLKRK